MQEVQMSKQNILDFAMDIADKHGLSADDATSFISSMFDVLTDGLQSDKQVKIKGLGIFKLSVMNARESVDVNTGERIIINSRDKISFIPDTAMRDLVNRPFSQFETVSLHSNLEEIGPEERIEEIKEESQPVSVQKSSSQIRLSMNDLTQLNDISETDDKVLTDVCAKESSMESFEQTPFIEIQEPVSEATIPVNKNDESVIEEAAQGINKYEPDISELNMRIDELSSQLRRNSRLAYGLMICFILFLIGAAVSVNYMVNRLKQVDQSSSVSISTIKPVRSTRKVITNELISRTTIRQQPEQQVGEQQRKAKDSAFVKYNRDIRIRTGAYRIVGIATTVTVRAGQTLSDISRINLGAGMDCYIEAVNPNIKKLRVGQKVNIPKLERKSKNKRN